MSAPPSWGASAAAAHSPTASHAGEFAINLDDSVAFARVSGDFNPLHVDPVHARRTQFGGTVVHGIHAVLKAIDGLAGEMALSGLEPVAIACTFSGPIPTGAGIRIEASRDAATGRLRVVGKSEDRPAFSLTMEVRRRPASPGDASDDGGFEPALPQLRALPEVGQEGHVNVQAARSTLANLFPQLARSQEVDWIADLLATTRIVGMECPGMHSIYSGFKLRRSAAPDRVGWMRYRVEKSDRRFRLVRLAVAGRALEGTIEAFLRPAAVDQVGLADVARTIREGTFAGQRALVIGGSRGLGEITAKILIAGGADVTITYATGADDAERICGEARTLGRRCEMMQLDVTAPIGVELAAWFAAKGFSHVYFFASPHISRNATGNWNHSLFESFCRVYARAFAAVAEAILVGTGGQARPASFFFPSTIFLDRPENGFAEYCAAKAAGEFLCSYLGQRYRAAFARPRLPRLRTDQTSGLAEGESQEPLAVMHPILVDFHAALPASLA